LTFDLLKKPDLFILELTISINKIQ